MMRYVPRWLYTGELAVPASASFLELDSTVFENKTQFRMKLKWISCVGFGSTVPAEADWGDPGHAVAITLGLSGRGTLVPTPINISTLFCDRDPVRLAWSRYLSPGAAYDFEHDVVVPPNTGLICKVKNFHPTVSWRNPTAVFKAEVRDPGAPDKNPVVLADRAIRDVRANDFMTLRGSGLQNDGKVDAVLKRMILSSGAWWGYAKPDEIVSPNALRYTSLGWNINPSTGVQWMPDPSPIPIGALAPFNRHKLDFFDSGPKVYRFADNLYMDPEQRLEVGLYSNEAEDIQHLGLCLHGYLEVE